MQHPFIWHDLMTPNVDAAKTFYAAVVGWTFSEQMPGYAVTLADGLGMGGILETPPEMKGMPAMCAKRPEHIRFIWELMVHQYVCSLVNQKL